MQLFFDSVKIACVFTVMAYLFTRFGLFSRANSDEKIPILKRAVIIVIFTFIATSWFAVKSIGFQDAFVNTTVAGVSLAGFLFGYATAACVAVIVGIICFIFMEVPLALAFAVTAVLAVIISGYIRRKYPDPDAVMDGIIVGLLEIFYMLLLLVFLRPVEAAKEIIYSSSFPTIIVNGLAVIFFILIINDINEREILWKKESASRSELAAARRIQEALLETRFDIDPRLDLSAHITPAYDVGGDLYSFRIEDKRYFKFLIGDVSGKGIPASIVMSRTETLFQEICRYYMDPAEILTILNKRLCKNNKAMMFVTAAVGVFDLEENILVYSNAGHVQPYLIDKGKEAAEMELPKGKALGIMPKCHYESVRCKLENGQYVLQYSDGVTEAENGARTLFGNDRLKQTVSGLDATSAETIRRTVFQAVEEFRENALQSDDIAVFVFGRRENA